MDGLVVGLLPHSDPPFAHWDACFQAFGCTILSSYIFFHLAPIVFNSLFPQRWASLTPAQALCVSLDVVKIIPQLVVAILMVPEIVAIHQTVYAVGFLDTPYILASRTVGIATSIAIAEMLLNLVLLLCYGSLAYESLGNFYFFTWVHHLLSIALWPVSVYTSLYVYWLGWFLFSELSNSLLNVRDVMISLGLDKAETNGYPGLFKTVSATWLLQYVCARMLPMPVMLFVFFRSDFSAVPLLCKVIGHLSIPIPLMLNITWFTWIVQAIAASIHSDGKVMQPITTAGKTATCVDKGYHPSSDQEERE